jgi:hypothetical protein
MVKTEEQAQVFGGTAGVIMHPCYHTPCDRVDSVHRTSLAQMADAAAHATLWFAMDGEAP